MKLASPNYLPESRLLLLSAFIETDCIWGSIIIFVL